MMTITPSLHPGLPAMNAGGLAGDFQPVQKLGSSRNEIGFTQTSPGLLEARLERDYQLTLDQMGASVKLENQKLGTAITIFAQDAAIMPESGDKLNFVGKTSLAFGNDSKITLITDYKPGQTDPVKISDIIISSEHKGSVISGLGKPGVPLTIDSGKSGYHLDEIHKDGLLLVEKRDGDYKHENGAVLDQKLLDKTMEGGRFGPQTDKQSGQEFLQKIVAIMVRNLSIMSVSMAYSRINDLQRDDTARDANKSADRSSEERKASERRLLLLQEQTISPEIAGIAD
ncbi:DUF1521 domain-containing protein [Sphingorhabdus arenilitoris]|uniref:DUF1521 domain-containing protein n=1 Tax=Sphingorhabdus arenilitoris TaxID=1490041 RepID=A0ABV8RI81_9SPHN